MSIRQRSKGQSAVAGAAYMSAEKLFCEYDQRTKNFCYKQKEIVAKGILLPPNAPREYTDRQTLWNAVEASEKQWNAQLARGIIMALPRELPADQYESLVREYCMEQFVLRGMIVDYAIHDKGDGNVVHQHPRAVFLECAVNHALQQQRLLTRQAQVERPLAPDIPALQHPSPDFAREVPADSAHADDVQLLLREQPALRTSTCARERRLALANMLLISFFAALEQALEECTLLPVFRQRHVLVRRHAQGDAPRYTA